MSTSSRRRTPLSETVLLSIALSALSTAACAQPCPTGRSTIEMNGYPGRLAVGNGTLGAALWDAGVATVDVRDPASPKPLVRLDTPGQANDIALQGTLAAVADGTGGLLAVDLADPARPVSLGGLPLDNCIAVALDGRFAYAVSQDEGLAAVDLADPAHPVRTDLVPWEGSAAAGGVSLHASGGLLFATDLYAGILIYDLQDPAHPLRISQTVPYGMPWDLAVDGDRMVVAADFGILLYDVSDPEYPRETCRLELPGAAFAVATDGDYAFVADGFAGLRVVHIAAAPFESGYAFASSNALSIALAEGHAFVGASFHGVNRLDAFSVAGCGARIVPAAAHADGANGTRWRTDLVLTNATDEVVSADLRFINFITGPPPSTDQQVVVPAGGSVSIEDVMGKWGYGEYATVVGAVAVEGAPELAVTSRTYTDGGAAGTAGQSVPSFASDEAARAGEEVYCLPLSRNAAYRSNLGVVNISNQQYWVWIRAFDHFGNYLGGETFYVMPWSGFQKNDVLGLFTSADQEGAFAVISAAFDTNPPAGPLFFAYASVVDNRTGDPAFLPAVRPYGTTLSAFLPVFARARGAYGTRWKTELALLNMTGSPRVTLTWSSSLGTFTAPVYLSLGALDFAPDAAAQYFPSVQGDARGTLLIEPLQGPGMVAAARVYNETPAGTYGQTVPPLSPAELLQDGERGLLAGLMRTADYRTNAGFSSFGSAPARLRLRMLDAAGALMAEMPLEVEPGVNRQIDDVFAALGLTGEVPLARIEVRMEANGPVYAYASVVDNRSGDAVFIPSVKP
jgi:hypothetical protein